MLKCERRWRSKALEVVICSGQRRIDGGTVVWGSENGIAGGETDGETMYDDL